MLAEPVEHIFQRQAPATTLRCLSCGRSPDDGPAPRVICAYGDCQRDPISGDEWCWSHKAARVRKVGT
jgi:hypothetical protein